MLRVLQVVNNMHRAGLETMLMNYYRNIDRNKLQFDFLTHRPEKSHYDDEILSLGGRVYYAPRLYPQNYPAYFRYMKEFFERHPEYQIIHSHIDAMSYLPLLAAARAHVPIRIAHSHNTSIDKDFKYPLKLYFRSQITKVANCFCACGQEAGSFLFPGRSCTIIPNAIEAERFFYLPELRRKKRDELGLTNEFLIGHIGRLSAQKNHRFLIDIFAQVVKAEADARLLLVGAGEKEPAIRKQVQKLGLESKVILLGNRSDANELYQAMDLFLMPSLFEGIPLTGIEAQFAGLPCFFSDRVPREVQFTPNCAFISLEKTSTEWMRQILSCKEVLSERGGTVWGKSRYDIKNAVKNLEYFYLELSQSAEEHCI